MKETRFIAQNKEKWLESETLLTNPVKDPEKLSNLFTQIVDDLSYSRTYYPNRSVRVYLNSIARKYFTIIYSHHKEKRNRFRLFWLDELPQIIIFSKRQLLISLLVFLLSMAIGIFSAHKDPEFTASILGNSYVEMTKKNIEQGDPMAVYKSGHQVDMFLGITLNNLMVAFRTYVFGVFMAIGTLAILLYNGIMVGCFQFFFVERGLGIESALSIWLHGTLEISSIILAGGAGLTLGTGLIFPGTYSRLQAFQLTAVRSLKLMLGISPIFVLAGIIESFLTRYSDAPDILKIILIFLSAALIIGYFIVYPWMKSRSGFEVPLRDMKLPPNISEPVNYTRIKSSAEILKDTFVFYSRYFNKIFPSICVISLVAASAVFFIDTSEESEFFVSNWSENLFSTMVFALRTPSPEFILINTLCCSLVIYRVMKLVDADRNKTSFRADFQTFIQLVVVTAVIFAGIYLGAWGIFFVICSFGLFLLIGFTQIAEKSGLSYGVAHGWSIYFENFRRAGELQLVLLLLCFSFLLALSAPILYVYTETLEWNLAASDEWSKYIIRFVDILVKILSFYLVLPLVAAAISFMYYSLDEIDSATFLKQAIERFGTRTNKGARK